MVSEAESTRQHCSVKCVALKLVVPNEFGIELEYLSQNVNGVAVAIASWELDDGDSQVYALTLTLRE
jgi:hypothetical protein